MKTLYSGIIAALTLSFAMTGFAQEEQIGAEMAAQDQVQEQREALPSTPDEVYKDVEKTLGFVPDFIKAYPKEGIVGAWIKMKQLEMGKTNIDNKSKELISLAVAAQVPCTFCVTFHTAAAKANGATEEQIKEAVALAGGVREWSAVLNGLNIDKAKFDKDVSTIIKNMEKGKKMAE